MAVITQDQNDDGARMTAQFGEIPVGTKFFVMDEDGEPQGAEFTKIEPVTIDGNRINAESADAYGDLDDSDPVDVAEDALG